MRDIRLAVSAWQRPIPRGDLPAWKGWVGRSVGRDGRSEGGGAGRKVPSAQPDTAWHGMARATRRVGGPHPIWAELRVDGRRKHHVQYARLCLLKKH